MCKECHKTDEDKGICGPSHFDFDLNLSMGKCEICGKYGACVDCKAYKYVQVKNDN
jgi:hypothetical protein